MATNPSEQEKTPGFLSDVFQSRYREVTVSSIIFGVLFGAVMNMAITYAGLKIGFTIVISAISAVIGFGVLRGILGKGTILETNIGQTVASAVNTPTAGIIFTVPVLYLIDPEMMTPERILLLVLGGICGAILGVAFIIPLRKQMIDFERLRFPNGMAVAAILKSPGAGARKAMVLAAGVVVGALIMLPVVAPSIQGDGWRMVGYSDLDWRLVDPRSNPGETLDPYYDRDGDGMPDKVLSDESIDVGRFFGLPAYLMLVFAITPLSFGAGFLTGRPGLMVLAGGILAFFVICPLAYALGWMPETIRPEQVPIYGRSAFTRPLGIGMLLGGALMGVIFALPALKAAFKSIAAASKMKQGSEELGLGFLAVAITLSVVLLFVAGEFVSDPEDTRGLLGGLDPHLRNFVIALIGAAWIWFAGIIIAQCTGMTDWSPISGMALLTVVLVLGLAGPGQLIAAVLLGAALCVACAGSADMMQDLKTGYLVGAKPKRQQFLELTVTWLGPIISMGTVLLLASRNLDQAGVAFGEGTDTPAPQAQALKVVIDGVRGGQMPYALYTFGAILGIMLGFGAFPGLGVLVGLSMYLPIMYILTYGLGCIVNMLVSRIRGKVWTEEWGVPFCAGLIVGEAILALVINGVVILMS